jgi:hypothetical protein
MKSLFALGLLVAGLSVPLHASKEVSVGRPASATAPLVDVMRADGPYSPPTPAPAVADGPFNPPTPAPAVADGPYSPPTPAPAVADGPYSPPTPAPGLADGPYSPPTPAPAAD